MTKKLTSFLFRHDDKRLEQTIHGIKFPNPVGLSAGFDKDAELTEIMEDVGFGFMQVGTATLHPYKGNKKPRLTRFAKRKSILVNYGLKSKGVNEVIKRLKKSRSSIIKSISVGKTNSLDTCDTKEGIDDYLQCFKALVREGVGDFYTINISCPNTFGGEPFTTPGKLDRLLAAFGKVKAKRPVFVKMPINLSWAKFRGLLEVIVKHKLQGVIIGNLNKDEKLKKEMGAGKGGLSGVPTRKFSNDLIARTYKEYGEKLTIVGVGGIFSAKDAYEKIKLGASLVQLITGMIYEGPQLVGEINRRLSELLKKEGHENVSQVIGMSTKERVRRL